MPRTFILTLSCPQRPGIVHAVTAFLFGHGCDIVEHQQFDDPIRGALFLRTEFLRTEVVASGDVEAAQLSSAFKVEVADEFEMDFNLSDDSPQRVLVMVSKMGHCLNDLIFRWRAGSLNADLVAVVSNHEDLRPMAEAGGLPFIHVPVTPESKPQAEQRLLELVDEYRADVVVLARYMQVLSDSLCLKLLGRAINIHHSFLPGFKGAKPYHQAYDRGVKLVGATAHYVTGDLDEGPIIEQDIARISHADGAEDLVAIGRDTESRVLARAVKNHLERRVLLCGNRTVVFSK